MIKILKEDVQKLINAIQNDFNIIRDDMTKISTSSRIDKTEKAIIDKIKQFLVNKITVNL